MKSKTNCGWPPKLSRAAIAFVLAAALLRAQGSGPAFEVATIHPAVTMEELSRQAQQGKLHAGLSIGPGRVELAFMSIADMIAVAYGVSQYEVAGPPEIKSARWDIMAKLPEGATKEQVPAMVQSLLAERFGLRVHRETRDQNVSALLVTKELSAAGAPVPDAAEGAHEMGSTVGARIQMDAGNKTATISGGPLGTVRGSQIGSSDMGRVEMHVGMSALADLCSFLFDKHVVDATGLKGGYDVRLEIASGDFQAIMIFAAGVSFIPEAAASAARGSYSDALKKAGFRLESRKQAVSVVVVDSVNKTPTEN